MAASVQRKSLLEVPEMNELDLSREEQEKIQEIILSSPDYQSYHLLFALIKTRNPVVSIPDEIKASILCSALGHLVYYNDWTLLDPVESNERQAGQEILDVGKNALICLVPLLDNSRPAPFFGSEDATMSKVYQYRINDFAFRYISLILKNEAPFLPQPQSRDSLIQILKTNPLLKKF